MADEKDRKPGLFESRGPVKFGATAKKSHLFTTVGRTPYTEGEPFADETYLGETLKDSTTLAPPDPTTLKSGVTVPRMDDDPQCTIKDEVEEPLPPPPPPPSSMISSQIRSTPPPQQSMLQGKWKPQISPGARVDPAADIRGNILIRENVNIAAGTIISAHEDEPIVISKGAAVFEGAVLTILPVTVRGNKITARMVKVDGNEYPLYIGHDTVVAPRAQLTGPCYIGDNCFIGAGSHVFWAKIGDGCIIEPGSFVMNVEIPPGHFVPSGLRVTVKENVKKLPKITQRYRFRQLGSEMLEEIRSRQY